MWFRRDLRFYDNAALFYALKHAKQVFCVFIYDRAILDGLDTRDRRVEFIWHSIEALRQKLQAAGGELLSLHAAAVDALPELARSLQVQAVFAATDYEPDAVARDRLVAQTLQRDGIDFQRVKDQVIFAQNEILTQGGKPFAVFTPYKNAWLKKLQKVHMLAYPVERHANHLARPQTAHKVASMAALGFEATNLLDLGFKPGEDGARATLDAFVDKMPDYHVQRDFPGVNGCSRLSVHFRFGTLSIRHAVRTAWAHCHAEQSKGAEVWLSELIWRDFYFQVLNFHPQVAQAAFKPEYDRIQWRTGAAADRDFDAWCRGTTGYPLVDAAMRQLNHSGYMHNRLRMVTASFLTKDLGLDWRRGERYFARHLNDYDLSANNGGWQWAASSGCDAQPYFRIFNPVTQSEKFDPQGKFIRRYCPELNRLADKRIHAPWLADADALHAAGVRLGLDYPAPIVAHAEARTDTLARYAVVKKPPVV
ncbi:MAG: cryptochrome/photolyase family protein [Burkholderiaceae bacterium]